MKYHALDISFRLDDGKLKINAPDGVLNSTLLDELKANKKEIIALLEQTATSKSTTLQTIPKAPPRNRYPLSYAQQRLWFLYRLEPNSPAYHMTGGIRVHATLDAEKLRRAFEEIIRRHDSLRTSFIEDDNQPWQRIQRPYRLDIELLECPHSLPTAIESYLKNLADQAGRKPYDLTRGELFRVTLVRIAADDYFILITMHHIISDGWSVGVLLEELSYLYESYREGVEVHLEPLPIQYVDYALWQRERLQGEVLNAQVEYWRTALNQAPTLLSLPLDHPRPATQSHRGAVVKFSLDAELVKELKELAHRKELTLFMMLLAGYHLLLSRLSGQHDVCVGIPVAGRTQRELEGLIGFFINAVVIRLDLSGKPTLDELFAQIKERTLGAYAHQEVPAELLLEALKVERNLSYGPLAQVGFTLQNIPMEKELRLGGAQVEVLEYGQVTAKYDLTLLLKETQDGIEGVAEYATDIFEQSTIERFLEQYQQILKQLINLKSDQQLSTIKLVSDEQLLKELKRDESHYAGVYPLTSMQRDLYLSWRLRPKTLENSLGYAVELHHEVDVPAWTAALQRYTQQYGALRSELVRGTQSWHDEVYRLEHRPEKFVLPLVVDDLSDRSWSTTEIEALIRDHIERPYSEGESLLNHYLYKLAPNHWLTIMSSHHLVLDGVGYATHLLGVCRLYEQKLQGDLPDTLPADRFARAIERDRDDVDRAEVLKYWQEELSGITALSWPVDETLGQERSRQRALLNEEEQLQIQRYCRQHKITPALYWKSIYSLLISGLTVMTGDVVLQEFTSGRKPDEGEELGCYYRLQPYVLRAEALKMGARFSDWLEASRDFHRRSRRYDAISILSQNRWLGSREPVYLYNYVHFYPELTVCGQRERIEQWIPLAQGAVQFAVKRVGQGLELNLDAEHRYLPRGDELQLVLALSRRLQNGVDELKDLYWSESQETRYLTQRWQEEQIKTPGVRELLEQSLQRYKNQEALVCGAQRLTYGELDRLSRRWIASFSSLGLQQGSRVILNSRRSLAGIVGWLALVRLGCCYIPLEGDQPTERLKWFCQESGAELLLQEDGLTAVGKEAFIPTQILTLEPATVLVNGKDEPIDQANDAEKTLFSWQGIANDPHRLFYQIYTSGSTGEPKGVQIREGGVTHLCHWYMNEYRFTSFDRHLLLAPLNFDLTQKNLYAVLASGGALVLPEVDGYDADHLRGQIKREKVTIMNGAPSAIYPLLTEEGNSTLRLVLFGGERIELDRIHRWVELNQAVELVNMYGPTECTDISTASRKSAEWVLAAQQAKKEWSLGHPIPGVAVEVRNRFGRAVPQGVEGELWIGGAGLGLGYTNKELTAEKFVGEGDWRRYRSGDRGYEHNSLGELVYLGRLDRQVKLRGIRLELGEIEAALKQGLAVDEAYAEVVDAQLVGFLRASVAPDWRNRLTAYLPMGLLPSRLIEVERWPLSVNGKLDRKQLQALARQNQEQSVIASPRTQSEAELLRIWQEVLGRDRIGIHDNFFECGGHSLVATQLLSRLRERFEVELPLRDLFTAVTIETQARLLDEQLKMKEGDASDRKQDVIAKVERCELLPASFAQQRLWFLEQIGAHQGLYNMSAALRFRGQLNIEWLKRAFNQLMLRHEALRSEFVNVEGVPFVRILESLPLPIYSHDFTTKNLTEDKIKSLVNNASTLQFDLAKAPLFRLDFYSLSAGDTILIAVMHHIISDGWSVGVLLDELSRLYEGYRQGHEVHLEPLPVQYVDYAAWQRERLQGEKLKSQIDYWQNELEGAPSLLSLPLDHPRPPVQSHRGAVVKFTLEEALVDKLKALAHREGVTLFMTLLAGYHLLLSRLSGQEDICVGIPVAGRPRRELEGLIGFFINAVVIRFDLSGKPTLSEFFNRVKEQTLGAYSHQEVPAEQLLEALKVERNLSYGPLAQASFALQNIPTGEGLHLDGGKVEMLEYGQVTAKYDLTFLLEEAENKIKGVAEYATDLFERSTIEQFLNQYQRVLSQLASLEGEQRISAIDLVYGDPLLQELGCDTTRYSAVYPLTSMQRDLYLSWQLRPETLENSLGYAVELHHEVDVEAWTIALEHYMKRYGVLRSDLVRGTRRWHEDVYRVERYPEQAKLPLEVKDLSEQNWGEAEIEALIRDRIERPYAKGEALLNHYLYKLAPNHWLTIMSSHHLLLDGVGYATHLLGVCHLYEQMVQGEALDKLPEDRYHVAIKRDREEIDSAEVQNYWQKELAGVEALSWRVDDNLGRERSRLRATLSEEERLQIQRYCRHHKVTPALYWKSVYSLLISGLAVGAGDVVMQEFTSGRQPDEKDELGCYYRLQPYVLRGDKLQSNARFSEWLEASRSFHRRSRRYDAFSILSQNHWLGVREPVYLYNYVHFYPELEVCGRQERIEQRIPQAEGAVQFVVKRVGQGLELSLDAEHRYLPRGDELELLLTLNRELQSGRDELRELQWSESQESRYQRNRWQEQQIKSPGVRQLLERSLSRNSKREALVCGTQRLTYEELDRLSRRWLKQLISLGLKPGSCVILNAQRSIAGIVGWLALVRLGCCYIPLEGVQPHERLKWLGQKSKADLLLQEPELSNMDEAFSVPVQVLSVTPEWKSTDKELDLEIRTISDDPERLFYQIYTSGSTGEPKGVQVREGGVTHLCHWYIDEYGLKESDRHLLLGSLNFDLTQKNLYGVLASGGTLVLPEVANYDADLLRDQIKREQITVMNGAPSVIYPLLKKESGRDLRCVLFGGERVELSRIRDWISEHPATELVNMYGPTECTDISTANRKTMAWALSAIESGDEWSLGRAIPGVVVEVRNRFGRAVPRGAEGEFWIGGAGVALGYTDPTLTAEKFVGEGDARRYKSGDRGYEIDCPKSGVDAIENSDTLSGDLVYLGRLDRQVKLRGIRLELGEIEASLRRGLEVEEAYAEVVDDQLVGYLRLVDKKTAGLNVLADWRKKLESYLPASLIPSRLVEVQKWPLTTNGKLDRNRLQDIARQKQKQRDVILPQTDREAELLSLWQEVLGHDRIGIHDNFFELGGHSLLATQLISRLRERYRIELPLRELFLQPTIAGLAITLEGWGVLDDTPLEASKTKDQAPIPPIVREGPLPLSLAQQRLWLVQHLNPHNTAYNMPVAVRLQGELNWSALTRAIQTLLERHEVFRSRFVETQGEVEVLYDVTPNSHIEKISMRDKRGRAEDDDVRAEVERFSRQAFDLTQGPLYALRWLDLGNATGVLLVNMHHIISDGWSVGILLDELSRLYEGYCQGNEVWLEPLPIQYVDYAVWQRERLQGDLLNAHIDYWRDTLSNAPPLLSLPLDHSRPAVQSHRGALATFSLGAELVEDLNALAHREGLTLFMVLLAGYHLLMSRLANQQDVCVGIPVAGRTRRELEGLVGFFINAVVIRLDLSGKPTLKALFEQIKEKTLGAYAHQEVPAELLLEALRVERNLSYGPLAQVSFALQNIPLGDDFHLGEVEADVLEYGQVTAKYDLTLVLEESGNELRGAAEYATDIFDHATIKRFLTQYEHVLSQLVTLEREHRITNIGLVSKETLLTELGLDNEKYSGIYPLTSMQRDLYLSWRLRPDTLENSLGYAVELHHEVDVPAWTQALQRYTENYGVLRSELIRGTRSWHDEIYRVELQPTQVTLPLSVVDLSDQNWTKYTIEQLICERIERPYTEGEPLLSHYLYKLGPKHWLTIMSSHHLLLDGVGYATHLLGVCRLYEQRLRGEPLEQLPEDRYEIAIQRDRDDVDSADVLHFWQEELKGLEPLSWSVDENQGNERRRLRASLSNEERQQVQRYCRQHKITPALYWKSVYCLLISGLTVARGDVVLQEFTSGRQPDESEELGCYYRLQPYVLRRDALQMDARFSDWLTASRHFHRRSRRYDAISILSQNRWLADRRPAYLYNYVHFYPELEVCGRQERIEQMIPQADGAVQFVVKRVGQGLELSLDAEQRYLPRGDELELILTLNRRLQNGVDTLSDLQWSESQETRYIMSRWQEERAQGSGVRQLLEHALWRFSEQESLVCGADRMTYAELDQLSQAWMVRLSALGLVPGAPVILNARRSLAGIVGWLALVRLGCCYIPLEGDQPQERLKWLCQESGAVLLLQETGLVGFSDENIIPLESLNLKPDDGALKEDAKTTHSWSGILEDPDRLFYQIYTSGSTGEPKGVQVRESGVSHLCHWYIDEYAFGSADRHLLIGPLNFDLTQKNIYGVLASGGTLVLPEEEWYDAERLRDQLEREQITVINGAPSAIYPLLIPKSGSALRLVLFGGERVELSRIRDWVQEHRSVELVNMYGPTECTDISTQNRKSAEWVLATEKSNQEWSLGQPIPGVVVEVKNRFGRAVPRGVEGEFWIGGTGVGLGYTDAEFTAEKFVGEGESRRYRSGDRGYELSLSPDQLANELVYLGRLDRQVKLRGMRIELGEIEAALRQGLNVTQAYAEVVDDQLIGYLRSARFVVPADWRKRLKSYLAVALIPSRLITLEDWPLTVNGKLDRNRLQELARQEQHTTDRAAPRNEREAELLTIWQEVLGRKQIGIHDNFFELGGHSLLAFRLVSRVRETWQVELPVSLLFTSQTVASMASAIRQFKPEFSDRSLIVPLRTTGNKPPLFCIHSGFGWITIYAELVRALGEDYPVYGIEQEGGQTGQVPVPSIDIMAEHYVALIKHVQPDGPYYLLGHSFGGIVAFALAQKLRQKGDEVGLLGLLDSYNPTHALALYKKSSQRNEAIETLLLNGLPESAPKKINALTDQERIKEFHKQLLDAAVDYGIELPDLDSDVNLEFASQIYNLLKHNARIALQYPMTSYPGDIVYFAAQKTTTKLEPVDGWARFVDGELKYEIIPGNHFTMMLAPQVDVLAAHIKESLP